MGGFHGGHHGGGHHTSHHSVTHHSYSHHSNHHYHYGYGRYYGGYSKVDSSIVCFIVGGVLLIVALFTFFSFFKFQSTATITNVQLVENIFDKYWKYNFTYSWCGSKYYGYGDDDYHYDNEFVVGDQYPVYFTLSDPKDYQFDQRSNAAVGIISGGCLAATAALVTIGAITLKKKSSTYTIYSNYTKKEEPETEEKIDDDFGF